MAHPARLELPERRLVQPRPLALPVRTERAADVRTFVPSQAEPAQLSQICLCERRAAPLRVQILDPQNKSSALRPRVPKGQQRGAGVAEVQRSGRGGGVAAAHARQRIKQT